jgi:hypothetical protein
MHADLSASGDRGHDIQLRFTGDEGDEFGGEVARDLDARRYEQVLVVQRR